MDKESATTDYVKASEKMIKSFLILMNKKNPNLKMHFHTSFDDFGKEYEEGKFVARANQQPGSIEFILQVDGDFSLPFEEYKQHELLCTSWRNNGYDGGLPKEISNKQREKLPADFDVVVMQGNPLEDMSLNTAQFKLYVIGGCAKDMSKEKESGHTR